MCKSSFIHRVDMFRVRQRVSRKRWSGQGWTMIMVRKNSAYVNGCGALTNLCRTGEGWAAWPVFSSMRLNEREGQE